MRREIVENSKDFFVDFLNQYNQCFYNKDIESLRDFYDTQSNVLIYFDNHKNNDTYTLDEHLELILDLRGERRIPVDKSSPSR